MTMDHHERRRSIAMTDAVRRLGFDDAAALEWVCALAASFEELPPWAQRVIVGGEREVEARRLSDPKWYATFIEGDYDPWDLDGVVPVWCDACDWEGEPGDVLPRRSSGDDRRPRCPACGEVVRLTLGWSIGSIPPVPCASWLRAWDERPSATPPQDPARPFRFTLDREAGDEFVIRADSGMPTWRQPSRPGRVPVPQEHEALLREFLGEDFGGLEVTPAASAALADGARGEAK